MCYTLHPESFDTAGRPNPKPAPLPSRERVTTIREDGSRNFIHVAQARGPFTRWRTVVALLLIAIYVLLPWIPVGGAPAVFLDLSARQFHLFGLTFVTQDLWLAFFLVSGLAFSLFYVSALLGRVWCGWACPQTVFLDLARRIERWCEGDAVARRRLQTAPASLGKLLRRGAKHCLYATLALVLAHVFLSYFVSLRGLYAMMAQAPWQHWGAFLLVFGIAAALWFDFAWFREQFCIVLCPYGRLQSALIDNDSLVIGYDARRGEPRHLPGRQQSASVGDCVDCRRCVQVCPTGIDIRQGLQMECIGCAACVDACNAVMEKLHRPKGLVRYDSTNGLAGGRTRWIRPRILLYTALLLLGAAAMTAGLSTLQPVTVSLTRLPGIPYALSGDLVRNEFLLRLINKRQHSVVFDCRVIQGPAGVSTRGAENGITVPPLGEQMVPLIVLAPLSGAPGTSLLKFRIQSADGKTAVEKTVSFLTPAL